MAHAHPLFCFLSFARLFALTLIFAFIPSASLCRGEIIYDNTSKFLNKFFDERTEYGDQVDLEGTSRRLTQILFEYFGQFAVDGDERVKVRLYGNETPYDLYRKEPTSPLYESDWMPIKPGYNTHAISGLSVLLPLHSVTFTVEFTGIAENESAGLLFYDPPTIGYSFNEIWLRGATGIWVPVLYSTSDPNQRASASLRLIADPEILPDQGTSAAESQRALRGDFSRLRFAQTFSPQVSGRLSHIVLSMQFTNQPVRVRILDTIGSMPGPNVLGVINLLRGTGVPQTIHFIDQAIYLKAGRHYAIELSTAAPASTDPSYFLPVARNSYARGQLWSRDEFGGPWLPATTTNGDVQIDLDTRFQTHMIQAEPSAQLISPAPSTSFDLGEPITLEARHRPAEIGSIARIRFLDGQNEIAIVTNAPFLFVWTNATPGEHNLRAIADDTFRRPFRSQSVPIFVNVAGPPSNDNFTNRLLLSGNVVRSIKPSAAATLESEPRPAFDYSGRTLWWSWTAWDDSPVTISAQNSSAPDTSVAVYHGDSFEALARVTRGISHVQFTPVAGQTYNIVLEPKDLADLVTLDIATADVRVQRVMPALVRAGDSVAVNVTGSSTRSITNAQLFADTQLIGSTDSAPATLTHNFATNGFINLFVEATDSRSIQTLSEPFRVRVRPRNDALKDAAPLAGVSTNTTFSSEAATSEPLDPVTFATNAHSIWYRWDAPGDGVCRLTVPDREPGSALGVYVLRNDNVPSSLEPITVKTNTGTDFLEFIASAGTTYHFLVAADHPETGSLTLDLRPIIRPLNDAFAHRAHLQGQSAQAIFRLTDGTLEPSEPAIPNLGLFNPASAWWSWTAPATGDARLEVSDPTGRVALAVFSGATSSALTLLQQVAETSFLEFPVTEGNVYHFRVLGPADLNAPLTLRVSMRGLQLVRPVNNQVFQFPAGVTLQSVFLGGIEQREVEFLANGTAITNLEATGSSFIWTNAPPGVHELRARFKNDVALVSGPVIITVATNIAPLQDRIFAGPFSRTSFLLTGSGEINVFGARPAAPLNSPRIEHQNPFHPASLFPTVNSTNAANLDPWKSFQANGDTWLAFNETGILLTNTEPVLPPSLAQTWSHVSAGPTSLVAIASDGELYLDATRQMRQITKPDTVNRWSNVGASRDFAVGLGDDGEIYLADPAGATFSTVRPPAVGTWTQIDVGASSALLRGNDGEIYFLNLEAPLPPGSPTPSIVSRPAEVSSWTDFAAGGHHRLFLGDNGALYASGQNAEGQLGIGPISSSESAVPVLVPFPPGVSRWTQIAAGEFHSLAIGSDCRVYSWGSNAEGQLGLGRNITTQNTPTLVESLPSLCPLPRINLVATQPNGQVFIRFGTILNRGNFVEYSDDLLTWHRVTELIPGDGQEATWTDPGEPLTAPHPPARFYRLVRP